MLPTRTAEHCGINLVWLGYSMPSMVGIVLASQPQSFTVYLTMFCYLKEQFVLNKGFPSAYKWSTSQHQEPVVTKYQGTHSTQSFASCVINGLLQHNNLCLKIVWFFLFHFTWNCFYYTRDPCHIGKGKYNHLTYEMHSGCLLVFFFLKVNGLCCCEF